MKKNITLLLATGILLVVIRNLALSVLSLSQNNTPVTQLKQQVEAYKRENQFLTQELAYVQSDEFVERQARQKLGLVKSGEYIVIAPPQKTKEQAASPLTSDKPNWRKWWELFF